MPPLVRGDFAFGVTVYIVLEDFGRLGRAYRETDEADTDCHSLIEDILTGQYEHIIRIVAFNTDEGWSCNVTEDIASAVKEVAQREGRELRDGARELVARFDEDVAV